MKLNGNFLGKMREAVRLLRTSGPAAATAVIQHALHGKTDAPVDDGARDNRIIDINPPPEKAKEEAEPATAETGFRERFGNLPGSARAHAFGKIEVEDVEEAQPAAPAQREGTGRFLSASFSNRVGTRFYKLYVPSRYDGQPLPLIVMLHGCKQDPDDFAAGTGMNRVAEENGCFVLYPAQARRANGSNCWNWFNRADQRRDAGEPSIIADLTRQVMREYRIDPDRVYIAGLSAGGAMAAILAASYPDLYAAVGIHSGLPVGAAQDVGSAFGAMGSGSKSANPRAYRQPVPAIVFHGDRDATVHPSNGVEALAQSLGMSAAAVDGGQWNSPVVKQGKAPTGRSYTQKTYVGGDGRPVAEHWTVHGTGHGWSGGSKNGSYTDPKGPDASREMMRFFRAHPKVGAMA